MLAYRLKLFLFFKDSGERSYHVPDLAHEGPKHDFSSSVEDSTEDSNKPRMKRSFTRWSSNDYSNEESQEFKAFLDQTPMPIHVGPFLLPWPEMFNFGAEESLVEEKVPTTEPPVFNNYFQHLFIPHSRDNNLQSNDINEVTYESSEKKMDPQIIQIPEPVGIPVAPGVHIDSDEILSLFHALRPIFDEEPKQQESSELVIMVDDVEIQVTRKQKQPTSSGPIPYPYYVVSHK